MSRRTRLRPIAMRQDTRSSSATSSTATGVRASGWWSGSCRWHASSRADTSAQRSRSTTCFRSPRSACSRRSTASTPTAGSRSRRYAVPTILGELKRHFRDRTWSVRVPRDLQELVAEGRRTVSTTRTRTAPRADGRGARRAPEVSEEESSRRCEAAGAYRATSLERRAGDEDGRHARRLVGSDEDGFARAEDRATLDRLLRGRPPREREVLRLRFEEDLTQAEIGERIGVSQMQVSGSSARRSPACA